MRLSHARFLSLWVYDEPEGLPGHWRYVRGVAVTQIDAVMAAARAEAPAGTAFMISSKTPTVVPSPRS